LHQRITVIAQGKCVLFEKIDVLHTSASSLTSASTFSFTYRSSKDFLTQENLVQGTIETHQGKKEKKPSWN
jgi:hypothetical protein